MHTRVCFTFSEMGYGYTMKGNNIVSYKFGPCQVKNDRLLLYCITSNEMVDPRCTVLGSKLVGYWHSW